MSSIYDDDPVMRRAEEITQRYADEHGHQPVTEERAAQMWDEAPRGYKGRRRANEDGTPAQLFGICADPSSHDWLENNAAQERRLPAPVPPGHCRWCGGAR